MKKYEKELLQLQIDSEKATLEELKKLYEEALESINEKIQVLQVDPLLQSKVYQAEYQKVLRSQIETYLDLLQDKEYNTLQEYIKDAYEQGFVGTMYSLTQQGIPLILPMSQDDIIRAIQIDSAIKETLYTKLGVDVKELKKAIRHEVARGISTGLSYHDIARNLSNVSNVALNKTLRIARTEAHRVQCQAAMDASTKAKEKGADVVKQWDATLDDRTRKRHRQVDGEIREIDEPFSNELMYPGDPNGGASEVVNCRCTLLQRAKWALDEEELDILKERAKYYGLTKEKAKSFKEFRKTYIDALKKADKDSVLGNVQKSSESTSQEKALEKNVKSGTIVSGARIFNPESKEGKAFARMYYPEIRSFSTDCKKIANNIGKSEEEIASIKDYLFYTDSFEPDCAIAQSWQRLMDGKNIQKHDKTLIEHELYEMELKKENPNISHIEAHTIATKKYDYQKEVDEYYGNLKENKKNE